jgi:hypothetical protein
MESVNLLEEEKPYLVAEPLEVLRILQDIQQEKAFVTMSLPHGLKILTLLLEVDENSEYILFDIGRDRGDASDSRDPVDSFQLCAQRRLGALYGAHADRDGV